MLESQDEPGVDQEKWLQQLSWGAGPQLQDNSIVGLVEGHRTADPAVVPFGTLRMLSRKRLKIRFVFDQSLMQLKGKISVFVRIIE